MQTLLMCEVSKATINFIPHQMFLYCHKMPLVLSKKLNPYLFLSSLSLISWLTLLISLSAAATSLAKAPLRCLCSVSAARRSLRKAARSFQPRRAACRTMAAARHCRY